MSNLCSKFPSFPPVPTLTLNPRSWDSSIREGSSNSLYIKHDFLGVHFNSFSLPRQAFTGGCLCLRHYGEHRWETWARGVPIPPLQRPQSFQRDKYRQKEENDNTYYIDIEKTRTPLLEEMESEWDFGGEVWHAGGWAGVLILNKLVRDYQFLFSSSSFSSLSPLLFLSSLSPPAFLIIMMYFQGQSQQWV